MATKLRLIWLDDGHVRDRTKIQSWLTEFSENFVVYVANPGAGDYDYNATTGVFTENIGAGDWDQETPTIYIDSEADESDVEAVLRTIEIINQALPFTINAESIFIKIGVSKQVLADGDEEYAKLDVFEDGSNLSSLDGYESEFRLYKDAKDINDDATDTYARLNGVRNFIASPDVPSPSDVTKAVSIQFTMYNDAKIFDIQLIVSNRAEIE